MGKHAGLSAYKKTCSQIQGVPKLALHFLFAHFSGSEASRNKILGTRRELVPSGFQNVQDLDYRINIDREN